MYVYIYIYTLSIIRYLILEIDQIQINKFFIHIYNKYPDKISINNLQFNY